MASLPLPQLSFFQKDALDVFMLLGLPEGDTMKKRSSEGSEAERHSERGRERETHTQTRTLTGCRFLDYDSSTTARA